MKPKVAFAWILGMSIVATSSYCQAQMATCTDKPVAPESQRDSEYLFQRPGSDQYIYVDSSKKTHSYDSFRLFVGAPGSMNERKIKSVSRLRDGGTTDIVTDGGEVLHVPSGFSRNKPNATWIDTYPLKELNPLDFDLSSLKIPGVPTLPPCAPAKDTPQTEGSSDQSGSDANSDRGVKLQ